MFLVVVHITCLLLMRVSYRFLGEMEILASKRMLTDFEGLWISENAHYWTSVLQRRLCPCNLLFHFGGI